MIKTASLVNLIFVLSEMLHFTNPYNRYDTSASNTIAIELRLNPKALKDSGKSVIAPVDYIDQRDWKQEWKKHHNGVVHWSITTDKPIYLNIHDLLIDPKFTFWLAEPGDKVIIASEGAKYTFSGKGFEKYQLQYQLDSFLHNYPKPTNRRDYKINSIEDYFEWNAYLNKRINIGLRLIESKKKQITTYSYNLIKDEYIRETIASFCSKFTALWEHLKTNNISMTILCQIYDSTFRKSTTEWSHHLSSAASNYPSLTEYAIYRDYSFESNKIPSKEKIALQLCQEALQTYRGRKREQYIVNSFPKQLMIDLGFTPEVEKLLDQYYAEPGWPEYKTWMKEQELKIREKVLNNKAPDFSLQDIKGVALTKEQLRGKFAIINFWTTGSSQSARLVKPLQKIHEKFKNDSNVVFLSISADSDKAQWLSSISQEKYTISNGLHVYTNGQGINHRIIRQYAVNGFPTLWVMHPDGNIIKTYQKLDPIKDNGKSLIELLLKNLSYSKDGPYVIREGDSSIIWYINNDKVSKKKFPHDNKFPISVHTDLDTTFSIILKPSLTTEPVIYKNPSKILALSDIEGNFDALRNILQANQVIDEHYNWIFGDGHLVFAGDMFDRGPQVTECLWLIYSLENKAKAANGYVHFVLGNHEIMNLSGDHRYTQTKYKYNAALLGKKLQDLYSQNSELGKWLRTKNIMEKIGDLLFVHGGISHQVWRMSLNITEINDLARPYYSQPIDSTNQNLAILYGNKRRGNEKSYPSPFWFRGYYGDIDNPFEIPTMDQLDSTLQKFNVSKIITGHTIVADTISTHYEGKIINIDTHHAHGKSEALLIEGGLYYRVNPEGVRKRLF